MAARPPRIKTIIPTSQDYFAAFLPDKDNKIASRIEKIVCWSLIERLKPDEADEVVGQIIDGNLLTEVTNVDDEEGFGEFLSYFESEEVATQALMEKSAKNEEEEEEEDEEDEEDEDEEDEEDEDEEDEEEEEDEDEDEEDEDEDLDDDDDEGEEEDEDEGDDDDFEEEDE